MEHLIVSRYTHLFSYKEADQIEYLVYNACTNAFIKLDKTIYDILDAYKKNPSTAALSLLSEKHIKTFQKVRILISSGEDEAYINQCEMKAHLETFSTSHLSLSLAPTSACNFRCPYCYEESKPNVTMNDDMIDHLIRFINKHQLVWRRAINGL